MQEQKGLEAVRMVQGINADLSDAANLCFCRLTGFPHGAPRGVPGCSLLAPVRCSP